MKPAICEQFGIDFPLFAFSHCRDVVAAVTNAGGFGVLGATAYTPEQLDQELSWIDDQVGGKPYGADIIVPATFEGKGEKLSRGELADRIPESYRGFVAELLAQHDIEPEQSPRIGRSSLSGDTGRELLDVAMSHPIKLIANALGVPPDYMIDAGRERGVPVAALVGAKEHAIKQVDAGVDLIVAQGTEAGGHCGEVTTMVLIPEVIEAIGGAVPVLAAGGIVTGRQMAAAVAMGADGAWTGSVWMTTEEAETAPTPCNCCWRPRRGTPSDRPAGPENRRGSWCRTGPTCGCRETAARNRCRCRCSRCSSSPCCAGSTCWRRKAIRVRRRWRPTSSVRASA